jgi:hypothetical protein
LTARSSYWCSTTRLTGTENTAVPIAAISTRPGPDSDRAHQRRTTPIVHHSSPAAPMASSSTVSCRPVCRPSTPNTKITAEATATRVECVDRVLTKVGV